MIRITTAAMGSIPSTVKGWVIISGVLLILWAITVYILEERIEEIKRLKKIIINLRK